MDDELIKDLLTAIGTHQSRLRPSEMIEGMLAALMMVCSSCTDGRTLLHHTIEKLCEVEETDMLERCEELVARHIRPA